ncbi:four helix bundle protein [Vibrio natriegens]|uniref:four helix bundle protein n=1 Tax=Vibrio natriegens TaxID=691 RepID=UPI00080442B1|nr:four helix bundle protein [Vibrio natriegens]ANQ15908.1 four helix bundle protein [Vibrio natriegens]
MKFEQLGVWKRSSRLASNVYKLMRNCQDYGFKDQLTRSALSVPSNIAEGLERETSKEESRFLYYAKGSLGELLTQTYIGIDIGYIDKESGLVITAECKEIATMIAGLIKIRKGFVREEAENYIS